MAEYYSGAVAVGMLLGIFFMGMMAVFIDRINWFKFKKYFLRCNDAKKKEIMDSLNIVENEFEHIADKTNTALFKTKANGLSDFLNYLKKYWLN